MEKQNTNKMKRLFLFLSIIASVGLTSSFHQMFEDNSFVFECFVQCMKTMTADEHACAWAGELIELSLFLILANSIIQIPLWSLYWVIKFAMKKFKKNPKKV